MAENKALTQGLGILGPTDEARQRAQRISQSTAPLRRGIGSGLESVQRSMSMGPVLGIMDQLSRIGSPLVGGAYEVASPIASALGFEKAGANYDLMGDELRGMSSEASPIGSRIEEISKILASGGTLDPANASKMPEEIGNSGSGMTNIFGVKGGRGNVVEKFGERPIGGRGKIIEAPGERAAAMAEEEAATEVATDPVEDAFVGAMSEYINAARGANAGPKVGSIDEYKKEFAEATGIDISGKPDKSAALMAFGLALMQNRAGKGFNVGRILRSVGEAGEAALPALEKAKQEARSNAIAAGKYALESRSADKAKAEAARKAAMNRNKYWVYKKGKPGAEFAGFDEGEFVDLNAAELDRLINNKDFDSQYEFIDAGVRFDILKKRAEGQDLGDAWEKPERISLIGGDPKDVPPELQAVVAVAAPNYKGQTPTTYKLLENPETVVRRMSELQSSITSGAQKFEKLISAINSGVSIPEQMVSSVFTGLRNLGIDVGEQPTEITQARAMLKQIAVREATNILQESGKTLSDNDRKRVEDLVSEISFASADAELIKSKLKDIYNLTVVKPQQNLDRAVGWLEQNAGITFGPAQSDAPESQAELDAMNEALGTNYTMDDFKK